MTKIGENTAVAIGGVVLEVALVVVAWRSMAWPFSVVLTLLVAGICAAILHAGIDTDRILRDD
jgi:hypothetical protein